MTTPLVTRFAPSPTGYLHIGGARTALFNWLLAKRHGGRFLLRIEDTDKERSTEDAVAKIFEGLSWLGLDWEGEAVRQAARAPRHAEIAQALLSAGHAYRCYLSTEELDSLRAEARATGKALRSPWRDKAPGDAPADTPSVVRIKAPMEGATIIRDSIQGDVRVGNDQIDDFVLLRSDGSPTYMLAVVVDDFDMGVTHVVRGDDHLINAARQMTIIEAMDWPVPVYGHVPLIHGPDGAKLSKRHGALGVEAYRDQGYLPEAMANYLLRLGWGYGDMELFSMEEAAAVFDISGINKAPARLDFDKLNAVNAHYIKQADQERLLSLLEGILIRLKDVHLNDEQRARILRLMLALQERNKTLVEMAEDAAFLLISGTVAVEDKAAKHLSADGLEVLRDLRQTLADLNEWSLEGIERGIRSFGEAKDLKFGKIGPPLRAAVTGTMSSPGLFEVLYALGREETLRRIDEAAKQG